MVWPERGSNPLIYSTRGEPTIQNEKKSQKLMDANNNWCKLIIHISHCIKWERYNWNLVESSVKHHNLPPPIKWDDDIHLFLVVFTLSCLVLSCITLFNIFCVMWCLTFDLSCLWLFFSFWFIFVLFFIIIVSIL